MGWESQVFFIWWILGVQLPPMIGNQLSYMQAWGEATTKLLGWWSRDDNAMPNPAEQELHISVQRHRPSGDIVVACSCRLPPCKYSWCLDHPATIGAWFIPVSQTRQGDSHCYRFVYASLQWQRTLLLVSVIYVFFYTGEWFDMDLFALYNKIQSKLYGDVPLSPTINGMLGDFNNCSGNSYHVQGYIIQCYVVDCVSSREDKITSNATDHLSVLSP
jgi:hypothetical protein